MRGGTVAMHAIFLPKYHEKKEATSSDNKEEERWESALGLS